jgi:flagellar protein FlaG
MDIRPLGSVLQPGSVAPPAPEPVTNGSSAPATTGSTGSATAPQQGTTAQPVAAVQSEPTAGQVNQAVQRINAALQAQSQQGIEFSIDSSSSHRIIVQVVDQQTNKVIRQFPSKEALAIADSLEQSTNQGPTQGLLIKQQA